MTAGPDLRAVRHRNMNSQQPPQAAYQMPPMQQMMPMMQQIPQISQMPMQQMPMQMPMMSMGMGPAPAPEPEGAPAVRTGTGVTIDYAAIEDWRMEKLERETLSKSFMTVGGAFRSVSKCIKTFLLEDGG